MLIQFALLNQRAALLSRARLYYCTCACNLFNLVAPELLVFLCAAMLLNRINNQRAPI